MTAPFPAVPNLPQHVQAELHDHDIRYHARSFVRSEHDSRGRCRLRIDWEDVSVVCWAYDMPPTGYCVRHAALLEVTP